MAFQITKHQEEFRIRGKLGASNSESLHIHFKHVLTYDKYLKINLEEVSEIDESGVDALARIHAMANHFDSKLFFIGNGCKDVYEKIKTLK
jgi:anti-anti-sigma regulatory factor